MANKYCTRCLWPKACAIGRKQTQEYWEPAGFDRKKKTGGIIRRSG
jgi:hypothetical protein